MEASTLTYSSAAGLHARSPLLRLQSDERLIALIRRGNAPAFEVLVSRYQVRLLAFCRHLVGSREDAEDVLQEVLAAAFNAIQADGRPINVRPWLYRIARNRCLNHLRRVQPIGVDSMDIHLSEHGASTADKAHARELFRDLVGDIQRLPETQKSALVLREMDALSYEQIAEAMETTVPSIKSLLVRARVSLAEAAEARQLGCPEVRMQLAEVAEGLARKPGPLVRRHLRTCGRCASFERQLKRTKRSLAAVLPVGGLSLARMLALFHAGHTAGTGTGAGATGTAGVSGATAGGGATAGAGGVGAGAASGATAGGMTAGGVTAGTTGGITASGMGVGGLTAGASGATGVTATTVGGLATGASGSLISAGAGALATKAAAGLAAAALVTAGAIATTHHQHHAIRHASVTSAKAAPPATNSGLSAAKSTQAKATAAKATAAKATATHTTSTPTSPPTTTAPPVTTTPTTTVPATTTTTSTTAPTTTTTSEHSQTATDSPAGSTSTSTSTGTEQDTGSTGATGTTGSTGSTGTTGTTGATGDGSGGASSSGASGDPSTGATGGTGTDSGSGSSTSGSTPSGGNGSTSTGSGLTTDAGSGYSITQ